jgi:Ca2+-binding RTX toxin-like protein
VNRARWTTLPAWGVHPQGDVCTIEGTVNDDKLVGTSGRDVICTHGGSDTVLAGAGNDVIYARDGRPDLVDGGAGRDVAHVDRFDVVRKVETKLYR